MGECKGGSLGRGVSELVRERVCVSMITAVREAGMGTCENAEVGGQKPLWEMRVVSRKHRPAFYKEEHRLEGTVKHMRDDLYVVFSGREWSLLNLTTIAFGGKAK